MCLEQKVILRTKRLMLRPFNKGDAGFILTLVNSPKWIEFIGDRQIHNVADAENYLNHGPIKSYTEYGFGLWAVELLENQNTIGMCGLLQRDYLEHPDIGFAFLPEYLGKGYGTESALATLAHAQNNMGIDTVWAITNKENTISIKLLSKIGMQVAGPIELPSQESVLLFKTV